MRSPFVAFEAAGGLRSCRAPDVAPIRNAFAEAILAVVAEARALLVIADIGGYTQYMKMHRIGLAHAEANTARLLEAVIDAVPHLDLIEIEGDAAFLVDRRPGDGAADAVMQAAQAMHRSFHREQAKMIAANLCSCAGCIAAGELRLKCIGHVGDVAEQTIRDRTKLVGVDVILAHRLLKNAVPVEEYVLLSEELYGSSEDELRSRASSVEQDLEGLGQVRAYFVDLRELSEPLPPVPGPRLGTRIAVTLRTIMGGAPYVFGLRRLPSRAVPAQDARLTID
jgi:hypothetical protein